MFALVAIDDRHPIRWFNHNDGFTQALFALAIFLVTAVSALISHRMANTAASQHKDAVLPVITFDIDKGPEAAMSQLRIRVRNVGAGPALDVRISWSPTEIGNYSPIDSFPEGLLVIPPAEFEELAFIPDATLLALAWTGKHQTEGAEIGAILVSYKDVYGRSAESQTTLSWSECPITRDWYNTHASLSDPVLKLAGQ